MVIIRIISIIFYMHTHAFQERYYFALLVFTCSSIIITYTNIILLQYTYYTLLLLFSLEGHYYGLLRRSRHII